MSKFPWGHESRHCLRCGKVGPRVSAFGGYIHAYCRTEQEKRDERQRLYVEAKALAARIAACKPSDER